MKSRYCWLSGGAILILVACQAPPHGAGRSRGATSYVGPAPTYGAEPGSAPGGGSASINSTAPAGTLPPPDGELLYERRESDSFGSRSFSSRTQIRGAVSEEVYIGNQRVDGPDGMVRIYDPRTGRMVTVSRP